MRGVLFFFASELPRKVKFFTVLGTRARKQAARWEVARTSLRLG